MSNGSGGTRDCNRNLNSRGRRHRAPSARRPKLTLPLQLGDEVSDDGLQLLGRVLAA